MVPYSAKSLSRPSKALLSLYLLNLKGIATMLKQPQSRICRFGMAFVDGGSFGQIDTTPKNSRILDK